MFDWGLDGKIKPVVTEKYEIEYGDVSNSFAQLEYSDFQKSDERIRINGYIIGHRLASFKLLIETLIEEIKRIVREEDEIDYTDESKLLSHLDSLDNQSSEARMKAILCLIE